MMSAPRSASRSAWLRPWPRAAPVMNATLPSKLPIVSPRSLGRDDRRAAVAACERARGALWGCPAPAAGAVCSRRDPWEGDGVNDPRSLFDLTGRVALVTGGSRGLGREMVLAFAAAGADVVIASRKLPACEAVAEEVRDRTGRRALPIACHVGEWSQIDRMVDEVYDRFGRVDVLVNNAGMSPL